MKKQIILLAILAALLLCGCGKERHSLVTIINNSDYTIVVTANRAGPTLVGSINPRVSFSYTIYQHGTPVLEPHSKQIIDMSPVYFEKFLGTQGDVERDRLRFYIINKTVFDAAGGNPRNLNPDDYLGYIDLSSDEARAVNWTFSFPDDTINNMEEE
jgi:hypothetical protein